MLNILLCKQLKSHSPAGFTVTELLVSLSLSSGLLIAAVCSFSQLSHTANDQDQRVISQLQAQNVIDMMTPEIRMIGNGVPFHQANFLIDQADLTDNTVTQPILVTGTTSSQIRFRLNESGETFLLVNDFDPGAASTLTLTSTSKMFVGDQIYITNSTVGQDDGLWATISAIDTDTNQVTLAAGKQFSSGATFPSGSLLEVVPIVTYTSGSNFGGVSRDDGTGAQVLVPNAQFSLEYLNADGDPITLPLVASSADPFPASAIQNVRTLRITVQVRSLTPLSTGSSYIATAEQSVGIRNLNFNY